MPILGGGGGVIGQSSKATTTVQDIMTAVSKDAARAISPDHPSLIDWTNRIHLEMLRTSRWEFLRSSPQYFMTQPGQTEYFIGTGSEGAGTFNTGLGLGDVDYIKKDAVFDRSNFKQLFETVEYPWQNALSYRDREGTLSFPQQWRYSHDVNPYVLSVYPPANNQNTYQPIPNPPSCTSTAGGALSARVYYVKLTFLDSNGGESVANNKVDENNSTRVWIPSGSVVKVKTPEPFVSAASSGIQYNRYRVYASTTSGGEVLQATVNIGTDWIEPTTGLVTGSAKPPDTSTLEVMGGYLIEFTYYRVRRQLTGVNDILQVNDDYKDIVIAGVSWLATEFLKSSSEAQTWLAVYKNGLTQIIRDRNLGSGSRDFVKPDIATQSMGYFQYGR